jgi:hypothetical protein
MKILYCLADTESGLNSDTWRCLIPVRAFSRIAGPHQAELLSMTDLANWNAKAQEKCKWAEVIILQRNFYGPIPDRMARLKMMGKTVIADYDDSFLHLPAHHISFPFWSEGMADATHRLEQHPLDTFKSALALAHAITVPSPLLAEDWQGATPIFVIPNFIESRVYLPHKHTDHREIRIGWGGSRSHRASLIGSGVLPALTRVCHRHPEVKVQFCGSHEDILNLLAVPAAQKQFIAWQDFYNWPKTLAQFDVGLAPLHGPFDDRRSGLKGLEYGLCRIPWIGSDRPPYAEFRDFADLVPNHPDAWEQAILETITGSNAERVEAGYRFADSMAIEHNLDFITRTYARIRGGA